MRLGRNAMAIYQKLVDRFGFTQRYNSVKRFCRALRSREPEQFDRLEFLPGEECQVDYGEGALTRHPNSGRYRRPRLFVMTLRYSRRSYRQVVWKSSSEVWARLHEQAFHYFGGSVNYHFLSLSSNAMYNCPAAPYAFLVGPSQVRSSRYSFRQTSGSNSRFNSRGPTWDGPT